MSTIDYGVRHPDGSVTVHITGHPLPSRVAAERETAEFDAGDEFGYCDQCGEPAGGRKHEVVTRQVQKGAWGVVP